MTSTGRSGGRRPPSCWPTCCWPPTWPTAPCWMPTAGSTTSPTTLRGELRQPRLRDHPAGDVVVPQPGLPEFTPERFVAGAQTLYLLSKNVAGGTSTAALVAALTTEVRVAAVE